MRNKSHMQNKNHLFSSLILILLIIAVPSCKNINQHAQKGDAETIKEVPFTDVNINDNFWKPRIETNRTVSIPSAFQQCSETGRLHNFALAGDLTEGEQKGDYPFDDTDVYKVIEGASYTLAVKYDPELDSYIDSLITLIAAAQENDGYLYTCRTNECERLHRWMGDERWEKLNT